MDWILLKQQTEGQSQMLRAIAFDFDNVPAKSVDSKTCAYAFLFQEEDEEAVRETGVPFLWRCVPEEEVLSTVAWVLGYSP